jgi:hypothetical protein
MVKCSIDWYCSAAGVEERRGAQGGASVTEISVAALPQGRRLHVHTGMV